MRGVIYSYNVDNKFYIGKTYMEERKRKSKHKFEALTLNKENPFGRAIRKYGWENVLKSYKVVEEFFADDKQTLNTILIERETYYMQKYNSIVPNGYNVLIKGQDGIPTYFDKEAMYIKISNSLKGKYLNNIQSRKVLCIETGIWYPSCCEAERQTGIDRTGIQKVATNVQCTAGGYTWKYEGGEPRKPKEKLMYKVLCVETGIVYESLSEAARQVAGYREGKTNIKISTQSTRKAYGFHWKLVDKTIPCQDLEISTV